MTARIIREVFVPPGTFFSIPLSQGAAYVGQGVVGEDRYAYFDCDLERPPAHHVFRFFASSEAIPADATYILTDPGPIRGQARHLFLLRG